jgi:ADP-ribosyl-[dinitrogen reductase] hydrolase
VSWDKRDKIRGIILGTAVGDSIGLPAEGISRQRNKRLFRGNWHHRFIVCRGMISDDTEHTIFVAQSLLAHTDSSQLFAQRLAWCLKWWLLSLPAGVGLATLKSVLKLWIGFSPSKSGVYSAGNGPAMRSASIGAFFADDLKKMDEFVRASTIITHTDPKALTGAKVVAYITGWIIREQLTHRPEKENFIQTLLSAGTDEEWKRLVYSLSAALDENRDVENFAELIGQGNGISGYIYHTVSVAAYAWYRHFGDFRNTLVAIFNCGGDTDTAGAIAGALAGAVVGEEGIPHDWRHGIADWPRGRTLLLKISDTLALKSQGTPVTSPVGYFWPALCLRNALFLIIVLLHGFRRLLPPY